MADSPAHRFGQALGNILEDIVLNRILKPRLEAFTNSKNYYLDWQKKRPARRGRKVTWKDKYNNLHDLDFVIEVGGSDTKIGNPLRSSKLRGVATRSIPRTKPRKFKERCSPSLSCTIYPPRFSVLFWRGNSLSPLLIN